jgi:hypothetical protein
MKHNEKDLISELLKSVEVLGVNATTDILKVARSNSLTLQDKRVDFVLKMVSNHFLHTVQEIMDSTNKTYKKSLAVKFSIFYLYETFQFSFSDLKLLFKRDKSLLSRFNKEIKELSKSNPTIKSIKNKFDLLITDFKLQNKY